MIVDPSEVKCPKEPSSANDMELITEDCADPQQMESVAVTMYPFCVHLVTKFLLNEKKKFACNFSQECLMVFCRLQLVIPKVRYSKGSLFRRVIIPKV